MRVFVIECEGCERRYPLSIAREANSISTERRSELPSVLHPSWCLGQTLDGGKNFMGKGRHLSQEV